MILIYSTLNFSLQSDLHSITSVKCQVQNSCSSTVELALVLFGEAVSFDVFLSNRNFSNVAICGGKSVASRLSTRGSVRCVCLF